MPAIVIGSFAFAAITNDLINSELEIQRAINGESDVPITQEMKDAFDATYIDEAGNEYPLDVNLTVRKIEASQEQRSNNDRGQTYAITAYATSTDKTEDGSGSSDNAKIQASGWLTVYWTDVLGTNNILKEIRGGWDTNDRDENGLVFHANMG